MYLETDPQTLDDLRIFSKRDRPGLFDLYNQTHTRGGEQLLRDMFQRPLNDYASILARIDSFRFLAKSKIVFPFQAGTFDMVEKYIDQGVQLKNGDGPSLSDKDIQNGVTSMIKLLQDVRLFLDTSIIADTPGLQAQLQELNILLSDPSLKPVFAEKSGAKISYAVVTAFDRLFRSSVRASLQEVLGYIYQLDVYISVAQVANKQGFCFPTVFQKGTQKFHVQDVYHPEVSKAVPNSLAMDDQRKLVFLTGANMAGKSTFLRSVGTAVFLTHMGFPVAARSIELSIVDGLFTTINLPDNLGMGASHFYAEVLRVKQVAKELHAGKSLFVIFDELFRGTNVKDAHEGTVEVALGFAKQPTSRFMISSHIVEAAEALAQSPSIEFYYLPTYMVEQTPRYTYQLQQGVTDDRHGMIIIRNEGILDILKNGKKRVATTH
jgi:DNA mismatch repair protein MutS